MVILMFSIYGLLAVSDFPKGVEMSSRYFYNVILEEVRQGVMDIVKKSHPVSPLKVPSSMQINPLGGLLD
jgi:hypothetical protein